MLTRFGYACVVMSLLFFSTAARAVLTVDATVTPLAGSFLYEFSIANTGPEDVILVTILDAPLADPLIDPTLMFPAGGRLRLGQPPADPPAADQWRRE